MPAVRPFLAMLLNAYEQGGESAPLVVVMSPSDEGVPVLGELTPLPVNARRLKTARVTVDEDPTEPNRKRHPLSSSDEPRLARNAIALYRDLPRLTSTTAGEGTDPEVSAIVKGEAKDAEAKDTEEEPSLTEVRDSLLPVVVGVSASIPNARAVVEALSERSRTDDARPIPSEFSRDDVDATDLPTWRVPAHTVILDEGMLARLARADSDESRDEHDEHEEHDELDATDPLLRVSFSSDGSSERDGLDEGDGQETARSLFRAAVNALSSGDRGRARELVFLATMHDPKDGLLACALSTLGGPPIDVVAD